MFIIIINLIITRNGIVVNNTEPCYVTICAVVSCLPPLRGIVQARGTYRERSVQHSRRRSWLSEVN